jgi:aldehyde dehydrogenase (NAD+)
MTAPLTPTLDHAALAKALSGFHLIDGKLAPAVSGNTFSVINPATGKEIARAAAGGAADVDLAVASAKKAQKAWAKVAARERGRLVMECARKLNEHVEELGRLIAYETGKALRTESRVEAASVADMLMFFGGLGSELKGETIPLRPDNLAFTLREPVGVVAAIIPWNVPVMLMAGKIAPAIVAGNTVVVKSAEEAPLAVLRVCQIMNEVLPPGVFNIVSGDGPQCGGPLVNHRDVKKITFTGSVETGRIIYRGAADKLIPATLELGGKSPMIVMPDADVPKAVAGAIAGMRFTRQGQSCTAASRMFVHRSIHDSFVEALKAEVNKLKIGDPLEETTDIGAIISRSQYEKIQGYIAAGEKTEGATAHFCSRLPEGDFKSGSFIAPVIFTGLSNQSPLAREEIFGPVTLVIPFDHYDEAIELANDTEFGLAASIWTNNFKLALDAVHRLEAGLVQVNQNLVAHANVSYGGVKSSGLGKEFSLEAMLDHFTHKKTILMNLQ